MKSQRTWFFYAQNKTTHGNPWSATQETLHQSIFVDCNWKSDATFLVLLDVLGVQVCVRLNWFKLLDWVLVSWGCCNRDHRLGGLNSRASFSHSSGGRCPRLRCGQGCVPSAGTRGGSVQASPRPLVVPWLSAQLLSSHAVPLVVSSVSKPPSFIRHQSLY